VRYVGISKVPFRPYPRFLKADLDDRQEFYKKLAEEIWNPERLKMIEISE
jgi:hypothetical protein